MRIAGPLQDVVLIPEGLKVLRDGIFQINYNVTAALPSEAESPAQFNIVINGSIEVLSSITYGYKSAGPTPNSNTLSCSILFSLLTDDRVQLFAALPANASCHGASLQLIQVG
ncbi:MULTISPECIES: hypothetical protein [unclassified Paenibacillus]|uniref:hypothetical protein n=1 Tax=unclassified Paenibacillus TaxID=185978 RepID=UPI001B702D30|nr:MULTISPECIES: hypothetical protein [unclassified Paenibacillus]MBP1156685.1 hypothetical protein [Paenibacillus sp. PvP091]MBP1172577.1 hypothetical protein [Paenibacillus sp. PvR098]MBP2438957.1 hypothetical protein [Paenibacillus sp. PvP052]